MCNVVQVCICQSQTFRVVTFLGHTVYNTIDGLTVSSEHCVGNTVRPDNDHFITELDGIFCDNMGPSYVASNSTRSCRPISPSL